MNYTFADVRKAYEIIGDFLKRDEINMPMFTKERGLRWRHPMLASPPVKDNNVFRFYCELKERVDRSVLQGAVDMKADFLISCVLCAGAPFEYHLEETETNLRSSLRI